MNEHALAAPRALARERAGWKTSPWSVAAVVLIVYAAILLPRLAAHDGVYRFVHLGHKFVTQGHSSTVITPSLPTHGRIGYDGQFYFFMAADPAHAKDYMDMPAYRWSRIGYPVLARAFSGGDPRVVPYAMLFINLIAIAAGTLAVAIWFRRHRVSPWFALLFGFFPGLVFGVFYDVAEPLGFALAAWGVVVFARHSWRRLLLSAGIFACALLTRETVALIPFVLALTLLFEGGSVSRWVSMLRGNLARAATFTAIAFAPMLAWRLYVPYLVAGAHGDGQAALVKPGGLPADTGEGLLRALVSLHGIVNLWPWNAQEVLVFLTVVVPGVATILLVVWALFTKRSPELWLVLLSAAVYILFIPTWLLNDYGGGGRASIGVFVPLIFALPCLREVLGSRSRVLGGTLLLWSVPFFALVAVMIALVTHHPAKTAAPYPRPRRPGCSVESPERRADCCDRRRGAPARARLQALPPLRFQNLLGRGPPAARRPPSLSDQCGPGSQRA